MNSDRRVWLALAAVCLTPACTDGLASTGKPPASSFGEANRQTMEAQVVEPDNAYDALNPPTSARHAGQAAERYRKDAVKKPDRVRSTVVTSGSGSGSGSSGTTP